MNLHQKIFLHFTLFYKNIFSKIRRRLLGKFASGVLYNTPEGIFITQLEDVEIGRILGKKGVFEEEELILAKKIVNNESIVYFIGTHIGSLLIPIALIARKVVGFEPNPDTFFLLKLNLLLNNVTNATIHNVAVGEDRKNVSFFLNTSNSGGSKVEPKVKDYKYIYDSPKLVQVDMIKLDEFETDTSIHLMIMDVEGYECFALKGMENTLKRVSNLIVEYVPDHLLEVAKVSNKDFLEQIVPNYEKMKITGEEYEYRKEFFQTVLDDLMNKNRNVNLWFYN